jgi:hypothetical protein
MQQIGFLLQNVLYAQHISGTIMPIIRSSRVIQMAAACGTWFLGYRSLVWCGAVGYVSGSSHLYNSRARDDGHNGARNMLSIQ